MFVSRIEKLKEAIFWPNIDSFTGLLEYIKIGFFAACITSLEWCTFEFMTLLAAFLGVKETAA